MQHPAITLAQTILAVIEQIEVIKKGDKENVDVQLDRVAILCLAGMDQASEDAITLKALGLLT